MSNTPFADDRRKKHEKLDATRKVAIEALREVLYAKLQLEGGSNEEAYIRARWMEPSRTLDRVLSVTLLDRLDLTGW